MYVFSNMCSFTHGSIYAESWFILHLYSVNIWISLWHANQSRNTIINFEILLIYAQYVGTYCCTSTPHGCSGNTHNGKTLLCECLCAQPTRLMRNIIFLGGTMFYSLSTTTWRHQECLCTPSVCVKIILLAIKITSLHFLEHYFPCPGIFRRRIRIYTTVTAVLHIICLCLHFAWYQYEGIAAAMSSPEWRCPAERIIAGICIL